MIRFIRTNALPLLRFCLVGVLNTGVYYAAYLVLVVWMPYLLAHVLAWGVAISVSFFLNCRYTYRVRPTWRRYALFPLSNLPNVLATSVGVVALVEILEFDKKVAPLIAGLCAVPFSYLLGKLLMIRAHDDSMMEGKRPRGPSLKDIS